MINAEIYNVGSGPRFAIAANETLPIDWNISRVLHFRLRPRVHLRSRRDHRRPARSVQDLGTGHFLVDSQGAIHHTPLGFKGEAVQAQEDNAVCGGLRGELRG